jgi:broad specificity phosphatase PhoE
MTHIYFVRHGATDAQANSFAAPALSIKGIQQVERLRDRLARGEELQPIDVLITSPYPAAWETAKIVAPALSLPVRVYAPLGEWADASLGADGGRWVLRQHYNPFVFQSPARDIRTPLMIRACRALHEITDTYADRTVLLVAPKWVLEATILYFLGMTVLRAAYSLIDIEYTSITHWHYFGFGERGTWILEQYNDAAHLQGWAAREG